GVVNSGCSRFDVLGQQTGDQGFGLSLQAIAKPCALADRVDESLDVAHEGAAALFGDDDMLLGEDRQGASDSVAVSGKPLCQKGFRGKAVPRRKFAADDVEADAVGDLTPECDATRSFLRACHMGFTSLA